MKTSKIYLVEIHPLRKIINNRGYLMEIQRYDDFNFPGFGQAYITCTTPGIIKAWYRHERQTDQITVIKGSLLLALYDERDDSPTCGYIQEIKISDAEPLLVKIPSGVWHGFMADASEDVLVLHLNTAPWNIEKPDEDRLPLDSDRIPYIWPLNVT